VVRTLFPNRKKFPKTLRAEYSTVQILTECARGGGGLWTDVRTDVMVLRVISYQSFV
jgi:hypothetical protein